VLSHPGPAFSLRWPSDDHEPADMDRLDVSPRSIPGHGSAARFCSGYGGLKVLIGVCRISSVGLDARRDTGAIPGGDGDQVGIACRRLRRWRWRSCGDRRCRQPDTALNWNSPHPWRGFGQRERLLGAAMAASNWPASNDTAARRTKPSPCAFARHAARHDAPARRVRNAPQPSLRRSSP